MAPGLCRNKADALQIREYYTILPILKGQILFYFFQTTQLGVPKISRPDQDRRGHFSSRTAPFLSQEAATTGRLISQSQIEYSVSSSPKVSIDLFGARDPAFQHLHPSWNSSPSECSSTEVLSLWGTTLLGIK